jgi:hypothetical protein
MATETAHEYTWRPVSEQPVQAELKRLQAAALWDPGQRAEPAQRPAPDDRSHTPPHGDAVVSAP